MNQDNKEKFNIEQVKVGRTLEGTIIEVLAVILLAIAWVIGLTKHQFSGAMGEKLLGICIVFSIAIVVLLVTCYFPKYFNHSRQLRNMRQVMLSIRMSRVLAIELALIALILTISNNLISPQHELTLIFIAVIGIVLTILFFMVLIFRAK